MLQSKPIYSMFNSFLKKESEHNFMVAALTRHLAFVTPKKNSYPGNLTSEEAQSINTQWQTLSVQQLFLLHIFHTQEQYTGVKIRFQICTNGNHNTVFRERYLYDPWKPPTQFGNVWCQQTYPFFPRRNPAGMWTSRDVLSLIISM